MIDESVTWVTAGSLWEHEWTTDTNVTLHENEILEALDYEIEVPWPLRFGFLRFSAPKNHNHNFLTKVEKFRERDNLVTQLTGNCAFHSTDTPKSIVCEDSDGGLVECPQ